MTSQDWSQSARDWRPDQLREYALKIVDHLIELAKETDPNDGDKSALWKDTKAWAALVHISELTQTLAGWAIHHQSGLASEGLKYVPRVYGEDLEVNTEFQELRKQADAHKNELIGRDLNDDVVPEIARRVLINCLRPNPAGLPSAINRQLVTALKALEFGEILPLFAAPVLRRKVRWVQLQHQLRALGLIQYRVERGFTKVRSDRDVAASYKVAPATFRTWKTMLRKDLGEIDVAEALEGAKSAAVILEAALKEGNRRLVDITERQYGDEALRDAGAEYQAFLYQDKNDDN
jgi:hypothetical protein